MIWNMKKAFSVVEILVGLLVIAVIGYMFVFYIGSAKKETQFSSDRFNAVVLSQKVSEDLIEEMAVNPYGMETLGIDSSTGSFQNITDGSSVFFSWLEDRAAPWGKIDPTKDGSLSSAMQPLYENVKKFKMRLTGKRLATTGDTEKRNLFSCNIDFSWEAKTGRGEINSECVIFSPATPKKTDLSYAVKESEIDPRIPAEVYSQPTKSITEIANQIGENVETVLALGRISLVASGFIKSEFLVEKNNEIAQLKSKLSSTPASDISAQYDISHSLAKAWYDITKGSFLVLAYLEPQFAQLQSQGKFNKTGGTGFNAASIHKDLSFYRIIYERFTGSLIQARYYYYIMLQNHFSKFKGGKNQIQVLQKLMDLYRIAAILPQRPGGKQEYISFLNRIKAFADGKNPFLLRMVEQELIFLNDQNVWLERFPNLKRIHGLTTEKIPGILAFIKKKSADALMNNVPSTKNKTN
ncbi:MAG: hypothetical protein HQM10_11470 [Candidatus Riflebacteria bacterium]|nr:hypothetical protein [Candidatus Riflebacteria bacterium]